MPTSETRKKRLTQAEIGAVLDLLNERLAGGSGDVADALGMTPEEADKIVELAESAIQKLRARLKPCRRLIH